MDLKKIVSDLLERGYTQAELAEACECSQPTISAIKTGETEDPKTSIGLKLVELHKLERRRPERVSA